MYPNCSVAPTGTSTCACCRPSGREGPASRGHVDQAVLQFQVGDGAAEDHRVVPGTSANCRAPMSRQMLLWVTRCVRRPGTDPGRCRPGCTASVRGRLPRWTVSGGTPTATGGPRNRPACRYRHGITFGSEQSRQFRCRHRPGMCPRISGPSRPHGRPPGRHVPLVTFPGDDPLAVDHDDLEGPFSENLRLPHNGGRLAVVVEHPVPDLYGAHRGPPVRRPDQRVERDHLPASSSAAEEGLATRPCEEGELLRTGRERVVPEPQRAVTVEAGPTGFDRHRPPPLQRPRCRLAQVAEGGHELAVELAGHLGVVTFTVIAPECFTSPLTSRRSMSSPSIFARRRRQSDEPVDSPQVARQALLPDSRLNLVDPGQFKFKPLILCLLARLPTGFGRFQQVDRHGLDRFTPITGGLPFAWFSQPYPPITARPSTFTVGSACRRIPIFARQPGQAELRGLDAPLGDQFAARTSVLRFRLRERRDIRWERGTRSGRIGFTIGYDPPFD